MEGLLAVKMTSLATNDESPYNTHRRPVLCSTRRACMHLCSACLISITLV